MERTWKHRICEHILKQQVPLMILPDHHEKSYRQFTVYYSHFRIHRQVVELKLSCTRMNSTRLQYLNIYDACTRPKTTTSQN